MIKEIILLILIGVYYFSIKKYSSERKSAIAITSGALMLFVDAKDALPLILTVSLIIISEYLIKKDALLNLLKYLGYLFLTLCIGAFPLFSTFIDHSLFDEKYSGFFLRYSFLHLSSFIYGLIIISVFLRDSFKETLLRIITLICLFILDTAGFFGMVISLGLYSDNSMAAFDIALVFYLLNLTVEAFIACKKTSKIRIAALSGLVLILIILSIIPTVLRNSKVEGSMANDPFVSFCADHTDQSVFGIINTLEKRIKLSDEEAKEVMLMDEFMVMNAKCKKLGISGPLFIPVDDAFVEFEDSDKYKITAYDNGIFNIKYVNSTPDKNDPSFTIPFKLTVKKVPDNDVYIYDTYSGRFLRYTPKQIESGETSYLMFEPRMYRDVNLRIPVYAIDPAVSDIAGKALLDYMVNEVKNASFIGDVIGIILSIIGVFIFIIMYFYNGREEIVFRINEGIRKICVSKKTERLYTFLWENRVYFISFLIPFLSWFTLLIVRDCMPFGINSLYDSDASATMLPSFWEFANITRSGNRYLSLSGGYGYSLYDPNPAGLFYRMLTVLGNGGIVSFWDIFECVLAGGCGLSFAYYMTHRMFLPKADKTDIKLLIPVLAYSLNSYIVAMHVYPMWFGNVIILPLFVLGFERMMKEKKYLLYGSMLILSAVVHIQLALHACIFMVLYFFTYKFEDIKDFILKGIRFAIVSILSALPLLAIVGNVLGSTDDSAYRDSDSLFPAFGFHKNFLDQWKQYLFMSETRTVSSDNGGLNVYMGIMILLFFGFFLLSKKRTIKEKLRLLIPVIVLTLSFNGQVLSFLWNGLHYQSLVPNRYAFLMVFMLCILSFEGIKEFLEDQKDRSVYKNLIIVLSGLVIFSLITYFIGSTREIKPHMASIILIVIYGVILFVCLKKKAGMKVLSGIMASAFFIEIITGFIYSSNVINYDEITMYGDIDKERAVFEELKERNDDFFRVSFPSCNFISGGMVYDVPSIAFFSSYANKHQLRSADLFGYGTGVNFLKDVNDSAPPMNSMQGVRYIAVPKVSKDFPLDIDFYDYVGETEMFFIYENKDALSLGLYMPLNVGEIADSSYNIAMLYNGISSSYLGEGKDIFDMGVIGDVEENSHHFYTDYRGKKLSLEEANDLFKIYRENNVNRLENEVKMHISIRPEKKGWIYLLTSEVIPLGYYDGEGDFEAEIPCPISAVTISEYYNYLILNEDNYNALMSRFKEMSLKDHLMKNDTITGKTSYDKEGYTMLSLAYSNDYTAYVDGKETPTEDLCENVIFIKTPAGDHEIKLIFDPRKDPTRLIFSVFALALDVIILVAIAFKDKRKNEMKDNKQR
ncbi:MAG TPA: hypothetical protein DCG85_06470 [Lachnospiraceae bacterium]|nr:hypothetical protein [Lachnospiraceae bacterium]